MSEAETQNLTRRPLVRKLYICILFLIAFTANEKTKAIVKFIILCSIPLIIGNHIRLEFACALFYVLLIVVGQEMHEDLVFGRIASKKYGYKLLEMDEIYYSGYKVILNVCLCIAYCISFIWDFSFKEAVVFLWLLPTAIYYGIGFLIAMIDMIFISGKMKGDVLYSIEINLAYKIEEIHLKNIYRQVVLNSLLHPQNTSGSGIKEYIEEELNKHDPDGFEKVLGDLPSQQAI